MPSFGVKTGPALTVMAACFGRRPERGWLIDLDARDDTMTLTFVESRVALIRWARAVRPRVVLLPLHDANGVPSAPLIARLRETLPNVRVLVLVTPDESRVGLAEAMRAGGEVALVRGGEALRPVLHQTDDAEQLSAREHAAASALLADVRSAELRDVLLFCVVYAHRRLTVGAVATSRGVSARQLARLGRSAGWPATVELIEWGRLLRAGVLQWRESSTMTALAQASGFAGARELERASVRLLRRSAEGAIGLSPLLVSVRLRGRVLQLERAGLLRAASLSDTIRIHSARR